MLYTETALDRATGDLVTRSIGNWVTVTEYGKAKGLGPRQIRRVLHHAGLLAPEGRHGHFRLPRSMVTKGMGKRHDKPPKGYPFDVLSPACQALLDEEWDFLFPSYFDEEGNGSVVAEAWTDLVEYEAEREANHMTPLDGHGRTLWVRDHFPDLTHSQIAEVVGIGRQKVSKYLAQRGEDIIKAKDGRGVTVEDTDRVNIRTTYGHVLRLSKVCSCVACGVSAGVPMAA